MVNSLRLATLRTIATDVPAPPRWKQALMTPRAKNVFHKDTNVLGRHRRKALRRSRPQAIESRFEKACRTRTGVRWQQRGPR
jgi:hypothetical protein